MVVLMASLGSLGRRKSLSMRGLIVVIALLATGVVDRAQEDVQVVEVTAERFSFTPSEVKAKAGTVLEFRLRSDDTGHGFRILGTDIDVRIPKRSKGVTMVRFTPEKAGRYTFECSKLCGAGHSFMRGVIVVAE
jgi:cytochrome c oxidase subunit 2